MAWKSSQHFKVFPFRSEMVGGTMRTPSKGSQLLSQSSGYKPFDGVSQQVTNTSIDINGDSDRAVYALPLSSEYGKCETDKARFWPWLSGNSSQNFLASLGTAYHSRFTCECDQDDFMMMMLMFTMWTPSMSMSVSREPSGRRPVQSNRAVTCPPRVSNLD